MQEKHATYPPIKRRNLLKGAALAGVGAVTMLARPAISKQHQRLRMATSWPENSPGPGLAASDFADQLRLASDGRIDIQLFGAGQLIPPLEMFDAVANGVIDMAHSASFYWIGKRPAAAFFTAVPFGLTPLQHQAWLDEGGGNQLWQQLYADFGIIPMAAGNTGTHMAGWFKRPINRLDDVRGLNLRMAGLGGAVFRALGANPIALAPSEMIGALASGVVDGVEFLGPWIDRSFGFQKYAPYYYGPSFNKPNGSAELLIAADLFQKLTPSDQALIRHIADRTNQRALSTANWQNAVMLKEIEQAATLTRLPADIQRAAARIAPDIIEAAMESDPFSLEIYRHYQQAQKTLTAWTGISAF